MPGHPRSPSPLALMCNCTLPAHLTAWLHRVSLQVHLLCTTCPLFQGRWRSFRRPQVSCPGIPTTRSLVRMRLCKRGRCSLKCVPCIFLHNHGHPTPLCRLDSPPAGGCAPTRTVPHGRLIHAPATLCTWFGRPFRHRQAPWARFGSCEGERSCGPGVTAHPAWGPPRACSDCGWYRTQKRGAPGRTRLLTASARGCGHQLPSCGVIDWTTSGGCSYCWAWL